MIKRIILMLVLGACYLGSNAWAISYNLDLTNDNNTGTSGPWATVTLTKETFNNYGAVKFVVDPIESAFSSIGSNFGLQSFYFNESTGFGTDLIIGNNPDGWNYTYQPNNSASEFGKFEFQNSGKGNSRQNPLTFFVYTVGGQDLSIEDFITDLSSNGYLFAAHIAGYGTGGEYSAWFSTTPGPAPVPEPGTMLLLGSGLAGLAAWKRRKKS